MNLHPPNMLHRLPNELLLHIMKKCPDLTSLWNLFNSAPNLLSVFHANALDIIEAVLHCTVPSLIQSLMRAVISIRTNTFECRTLKEAKDFPSTANQVMLPASISPALLRQFVGLARQIDLLANSCIDRCIQRCIAASLKNPGPPSWVERQRAILAFWRVQFFNELKMGRFKGRLKWPTSDLSKLQDMTIAYFYNSRHVLEQSMTADNFIAELRISENPMQERGPISSLHQSTAAWNTPRRILQLPSLPPGMDLSPALADQSAFQADQGEQSQSLDEMPPGLDFYIRRINRDSKSGILQYAEFGPYRNLGFALWDEKTMAILNLWSPYALSNPIQYYPRWYTLLSPEDIKHAEEAKESAW